MQRQQTLGNILEQILQDMAPAVRNFLSTQKLVLDVLSFLVDIISPRLRPVSVALLSATEKAVLQAVVDTMISYVERGKERSDSRPCQRKKFRIMMIKQTMNIR
jgi:hypothetical protein